MASISGAASVISLLIQVKDKATAELKRIDKQADKLDKQKTTIDVTADTRKATSALDRLKTQGSRAMTGLGAALKQNLGSVALGAATAITAFAVKAIGDFQQVALGAGLMRDQLGVSAEEASRLQEVAGDLGIGVDGLTAAMGKMNRAAAETPEAFSSIGASIVKGADGTTDVTQTFLSTIEALNRIPDATQRAAAGQQIFGRGWMKIAELITQGADGVRKALELVEATKIMDDADIAKAREFRDTMDQLQGIAEGLSLTLGEGLVDALGDVKTIVDAIKGPFEDLGDLLDKLPGDNAAGNAIRDWAVRTTVPVMGLVQGLEFAAERIKDLTGDFDFEVHFVGPPPPELDDTINTLQEFNDQLDKLRDPSGMTRFTDLWERLLNDLRRGRLETEDTADMILVLAAALGIDPGEVLPLAMRQLADESKALIDETRTLVEEQEKLRESSEEVAGALDSMGTEFADMADEIAEQSFQEALDQFNQLGSLDLAQTRQETVSAFEAVKDAIQVAGEEVEGWQKMDLTPDSIDEIRDMPEAFAGVTDAISGLRDAVQSELTQAFDAGGVQEFSTTFDTLAGRIREQFTELFRGMGLPESQVQTQVQEILADLSLLPGSKEIIIKLTRDQESKNALELLRGQIDEIEAEAPEVGISVRIARGDTEAAMAELNAIRLVQQREPIVLQTDVDRFGAEEAGRRAREAAITFIKEHELEFDSTVLDPKNMSDVLTGAKTDVEAEPPAGIATELTDPTNLGPVLTDAQREATRHPIWIPTFLLPPGVRRPNRPDALIGPRDIGGTVPRNGVGLVAEKRPEIINERYLVTEPTLVPGGTRVTSGARTARILRARGIKGLRRYDSGGTVVAGPRTINVSINAAVIGNRFDVDRQVASSMKRIERLMGTRA